LSTLLLWVEVVLPMVLLVRLRRLRIPLLHGRIASCSRQQGVQALLASCSSWAVPSSWSSQMHWVWQVQRQARRDLRQLLQPQQLGEEASLHS
jgi:hypothetical protein